MMSRTAVDKLGVFLRDGVYGEDELLSLDEFRSEFIPAYESVVFKLRDQLHYDITGRPTKSTPSIVEKLRREKCRLTQIQDIAGCRIVVSDILAQDSALGAIEVFLTSSQVFDRRENPSNGYRAVHVVALNESRRVEVQLRTALQHMWAEISEKFADTVDPRIKYGQGDETILKLLASLSDAIRRIEDEERPRNVAIETMRRVGRSRVSAKVRKEMKDLERKYQTQRTRYYHLLREIMNDIGA